MLPCAQDAFPCALHMNPASLMSCAPAALFLDLLHNFLTALLVPHRIVYGMHHKRACMFPDDGVCEDESWGSDLSNSPCVVWAGARTERREGELLSFLADARTVALEPLWLDSKAEVSEELLQHGALVGTPPSCSPCACSAPAWPSGHVPALRCGRAWCMQAVPGQLFRMCCRSAHVHADV